MREESKRYYDKKPWLKSYEDVFEESLEPYPEIPVFKFSDDSAEKYPEQKACTYSNKEMTYKEFKDHRDRVATALFDLGIKKGDRVATILPNSPQFAIADYGILRAGGVDVPCSPLHKADTLEYEIGTSGAKGVICLDESLELIKSIKDKTSLEFIVVTSIKDYTQNEPELKETPGAYQFRDLIAKYEPKPPNVEIDPKEDLALLQFTGGTTGLPKGVMLTHFNLTSNTLQVMPWLMCSFVDQVKGDGAVLLALPFFHVYGHWAMNTAIYFAQNMLLVSDARDYDESVRLIKKYEPWLQIGVPTQFMKMISKEKELANVKMLGGSGSAALHSKIAKKYEEVVGTPLTEGYGLSETSPVTHYDVGSMSRYLGIADEDIVKVGTIGVPVPDTDVKVVDLETGEEVPPGETGEMYVKGPQLMKGYWPTPGKGLVDGWLPTGDVVRMDGDGYFYIVDRTKDMINVSGIKVYSQVVDEIVEDHPAVDVSATIGVPDPERPGSERVKIFIIPNDDYKGKITEEEIINYCRERLEPYAVPKFVEFRDNLPLTPTLKVWKRKLKEEEIRKMEEAGILEE
jgi:long-chain acyl-CoA synthetase